MIKVVFNIVKSLFSLFFSICRPLKRLWCRRLKVPEMDPGLPIVVSTHPTAIDVTQSFDGGQEVDMEMEDWDAWDTSQSQQVPPEYSQSNSTYSQHASRMAGINSQTANHMRGRRTEQEVDPEPEPDYFQDMIPDFKKPTKIMLKKKDMGFVNNSAISSRLSVMDVAPTLGNELQSWEEKENAWGEEATEDLSWEAEAALKEKRRLERQHRAMEQQRKKQQRDALRGGKKDSHLAIKIS